MKFIFFGKRGQSYKILMHFPSWIWCAWLWVVLAGAQEIKDFSQNLG